MMHCNPDGCPHCQYIGEGDSWCDEIHEIVLSDWEPTEHYRGAGMPLSGPAPAQKAPPEEERPRCRHHREVRCPDPAGRLAVPPRC